MSSFKFTTEALEAIKAKKQEMIDLMKVTGRTIPRLQDLWTIARPYHKEFLVSTWRGGFITPDIEEARKNATNSPYSSTESRNIMKLYDDCPFFIKSFMSYNVWSNVVQMMINLGIEMGYTTFDISDFSRVYGDYQIGFNLSVLFRSHQELIPPTTKLTFVGPCYILGCIPSSYKKLFNNCTVKGNFTYVNQPNRDENGVTPSKKFKSDSFDCLIVSSIYSDYDDVKVKSFTHYENAEAYLNRPERLDRLAEKRKTDEVIKKPGKVERGELLTFQDAFENDLRVGDIVISARREQPRYATVVGQTAHNVRIKYSDGRPGDTECVSGDVLVRID